MRAVLYNTKEKQVLELPNNIEGSFTISDNNQNKIVNINSKQNQWIMSANPGFSIIQNQSSVQETTLSLYNFFLIKSENSSINNYVIYTEPDYDNSVKVFNIEQNIQLTIGKSQNNDIVYNNPFINDEHLILQNDKTGFKLININNAITFLNDFIVNQNQIVLHSGDIILLMGLKILVINNLLIINNPGSNVQFKTSKLKEINIPYEQYTANINSHKPYPLIKEEYFFKKPRIRRYIKTIEIPVASPPQKHEPEDTPLLLVIGPMLTMGIISLVSIINATVRIASGQATFQNTWMTFVTAGVMLISMLMWPLLTRKYQRRKAERQEKKRVKKYNEYIERKKIDIQNICREQSEILKELYITTDQCCEVINTKSIELWDRLNTQKDFLSVRVGTGEVPLDANIVFSEDEFSMEEDELKKQAEDVVHKASMLHNVPVGYSLKNNLATAIMGNKEKKIEFTKNILLQLVTFHSYDDLKLVFLIDEENENLWEPFKMLPHTFSNDRDIRFFATNQEEMQIIDNYIEREYIQRITDEKQNDAVETEEGHTNYKPFYLIITDNYSKVRKLNMDNLILDNNLNLGFGFIILENKLSQLPSQCLDFINLGGETSEILKNNSEEYVVTRFKDEIKYNIDYAKYCEILANLFVEIESAGKQIPESLTYLEMFGIKKVEQLNALTRWRKNDPTQSLRALVGVGADDSKIYLDLHEKYHGPHGLIAGMTGSGKSEFIITYILSMALNYSPEEVAFILIDYKGGGLAGAFDNKGLGLKLPHLSGVITNLDKSELNRTLVSINSELRRRQEIFNEAREKLGESTIDIYKYQRFYRDGKLSKPIPHLFIISDEFAELKSQQPDFMEDLISAARIGRSLGVHLILATQKPSGVVNDQIWSNSKFKVCLKVQDRSDSNEMLKKPDAAEIQNAGRFYLQVGYDELFVLGQSGYAGAAYIPSEYESQDQNESIVVVDNLGRIIKEVSEDKKQLDGKYYGDQLSNVLKYICAMAKKINVKAENLWLEKIPNKIYVDELIDKYKFDFNQDVSAIIGEYDDPANQSQNILTLPLNSESNTVIFGRNSMDREMFLNSFIYSLCTRYNSSSVNLYIMDFGSETLRMFYGFPQVGDVMLSVDTEKITKAFSVLNDLIIERKRIFADYNGDYFNYCKNSGQKIPLIVFIINNYESFNELYNRYEEDIVRYSREGKRYGIIMIFTSSSSHGFPTRIMRNLNNVFALELTGKNDYIELFGKIGNLYPADSPGRGMFKADNVYEFQTATIYDGDDQMNFIKEKINKVKELCKTSAPTIPVLPDKVSFESLVSNLKGLNNIPIGIERQTLNISNLDLKKSKINLISSTELENTISFTKSLITMINQIENVKIILIDLNKYVADFIDVVTGYCDRNFNINSEGILNYISKNIENKTDKDLIFIVVGIEKLMTTNNKDPLNKVMGKIVTLENANVIIIDSSYQIRKLTTELWYSSNIRSDQGIWIGSGITDQTAIRLNSGSRIYNEKINNNFAWVIKNGQGTLIKLMELDKNDK